MSYRTTIWNRFKQPWWPTSTSASLSLSCCTSQKYTTSLCTLHYPCLHLKQSIPNTLLRIFSAACNLDSEESSTTCHNLPVLLLLSRRWSLAVAVLLQHLMKNSAPINRKNMEEYWSQKNSNASQMQPQSQLWQAGKQKARKPISTNRNRQKAAKSAWISATLSFSCCTSYEVEPKWTKMNQNEPKWTKMNQNEPKWTKMNQNEPKWTKMNQNEPKWTKTNQNEPKWTKMNQNEPKWTKMNQNEPKWTKMNQNEPKWTKMNQNEPKWTKMNQNEPKWTKMNQNEPKWTKGNTTNTTDLSVSQGLQDDLMLFHAVSSNSHLPPEKIGFSGSPALVDAVQQQQ